MASSILFSVVASVLLVQTVYSQCINSYANQPQISVASSGSYGCGNNLGLVSNGLVSNGLVSNGLIGQSALNYAPSIINSGNDIFTISSGSNLSPNGISISAEGLEIVGPVNLQGSLPFVGAVGLNGVLPTGGQASVAYSSAPGVGITSGGCGQGLAGLSSDAVIGSPLVSGAVLGNNGILGNNLLGNNALLGNNIASLGYSVNNGCGCY